MKLIKINILKLFLTIFLTGNFLITFSQEGDIKGPPLPCVTPTTQTSAFTATTAGSSSIDLTWTRGDGDNVIILAHEAAAVDSDPVSGTSYTANSVFGSGTQIGTGNYVVYSGTGNSVTVTGLTGNTTYYFAAYEFNNTDVCYLTPGVTANSTTNSTPPTITNISPNNFFADKGATLTITGSNLGDLTTTVTLGGVSGSLTSNNGSTLVVDFLPNHYSNNTLTVSTGVNPDATSAVTVNTRNIIPVGGGTDFHATIQDALDGLFAWFGTNAFSTNTTGYLAGTKTIEVYTGTYTEKVTPDVNLGTTSSEMLIIKNAAGQQPAIDASGLSNAFYIGALDYVTISGFTAYSSTDAVIYTEGDNNIIEYNKCYGSTAGAGILLNSAASASLQNNLIYNNNTFGIRVISSNNVTIKNNTVTDNGNEAKAPPLPGIYDAAQLYVESGTGVTVQNNIFYAKSGTHVYTLKTESGITVSSDYNTYYKNGNNDLVYYNGTIYTDLSAWSGNGAGANDLESDPLFINAGTDFHIQSTFGSYPYPAEWPPEANANAWNNDAGDSPALDTGNPADGYANEPASGGRINQGAYGNTVQASKSVACIYPTTQASSFTATASGTTTIDLSWTRGNGDDVIILAHQAAAVDSDPIDGTSYTANATFGSGTQIGTGNYVVYIGTGTSVTVTGLTSGITYYFAAYEYTDASKCYLVPSVTANATTNVASPTISNVNPNNFFADKGTQLTITGTNLGDMTTTVTLGGITGTNISNDGSTLVVNFPAGHYTNNTLTVSTGVGTDATATVTVNTRNVIPVGGGTDPHATIQDALDGLYAWFGTNAFSTNTTGYLSGTKTIEVYNGTYTEKVTPNVNLGTSSSELLVIKNAAGQQPAVDASSLTNAFYIGVLNYVTISGFTAYSSTDAVIYTEGDNNIIEYNKCYGSTAGAGILLNSAASASLQNNLIYNNNTFGIRIISSNNVTIKNNTVTDNGNEAKAPPLPSVYTPAQIYVESGTGTSVKNNIISAKSGSNIFTMMTETTVTVASDYNTYYKNGNANLVYYNGTVYADLAAWNGNGAGANEKETDPTFAGSGDYHILSTAGSYHGGEWPPLTTTSGTWTLDGSTSSALDAGDPADAYTNEPQSGNIINQGAYGNTLQASKSPSSFVWVGGDGGGAQRTDWDRAGNWSGNAVPTSSDNAVIPAGRTYYPIVNVNDATCNNLNMADGSDMEVTTGGIVAVTGNLNFGEGTDGTIKITGGTLNVSGTFTANNGSNLTITSGDVTMLTRILNSGSIVTYNGNNQILKNWNYQDVILNGTGTMLIDGTTGTPTTAVNFTINNTGNVLNIPEGKALTVTGTLTNNVGNTGIVVKSSSAGDGSLIFNNTGINGTVERYLSKTNGETGQWHFIGSPITAAPVSLFNTNNFYEYDETADDWWTGATYFYNTPSGWQVPAGNLATGKGYIYYYYETTLDYQGEINYNSAGYSIPIGYTSHSGNAANGDPYTNFDGWQLISNPFPSALDWAGMSLTNLNNTVYYYDDANDNYKYFNGAGGTQTDIGITVNGGSQFIPMGQAFMVKTNNTGGGTFQIPLAARVHNTQAFWKNNYETPENLIRIKIADNDFSDETVLRMMNDANITFDDKFDAYKRYSWNDAVPQIFTVNPNESIDYSINSIEPVESNIVIPLAYKINHSGEFNLQITEFNFNNYIVYIHDISTDIYTEINDNFKYKFYTEAGLFKNRLELVFKRISSDITNFESNNVLLYPNPNIGSFYVSVNNFSGNYRVEITNVTGQLIYQNKFFNLGINEIKLDNVADGIYFVKIIFNNNNTVNKKIVIE